MPPKTLEIPPEMAQRFLDDLRAVHAETNGIKRDEIAARQLYALRPYVGPYDGKLRLTDVKEMFEEMRDYG